jgi:hypothetical protein
MLSLVKILTTTESDLEIKKITKPVFENLVRLLKWDNNKKTYISEIDLCIIRVITFNDVSKLKRGNVAKQLFFNHFPNASSINTYLDLAFSDCTELPEKILTNAELYSKLSCIYMALDTEICTGTFKGIERHL